MRTLREIFEDHAHYGSDVGHADKGSTHSYIEEYERLLAPYRDGKTIMEIGLAMGESLKMWNEYFTNSKIIGVDIKVVFNPLLIRTGSNRVYVMEADATNQQFIKDIFAYGCTNDDSIRLSIKNQKFDVIIDDGSHMAEDQIATFNLLKGYMNTGGLYIIEDILALDVERERFLALNPDCEIIDLRHVKGRFDDVLIVYKF